MVLYPLSYGECLRHKIIPVMILKKKVRLRLRLLPLFCLAMGAVLGASVYATTFFTGLPTVLFCTPEISLEGAYSALVGQLVFFVICALSGFSSFAPCIPCTAVFIRGLLASLSMLSSLKSMADGLLDPIFFCVFATASAAICILLTSSARLACIFRKIVPHNKTENVLDYVARQLYTVGVAFAIMVTYFAASAAILK